MTKVHKIELMVIDHDNIGEENVKEVIENISYPNDCIWPQVMHSESKEIEWTDDHPLNLKDKDKIEFNRLFNV